MKDSVNFWSKKIVDLCRQRDNTRQALWEALEMIELATEQAHEGGVDCEQMMAFVERTRKTLEGGEG